MNPTPHNHSPGSRCCKPSYLSPILLMGFAATNFVWAYQHMGLLSIASGMLGLFCTFIAFVLFKQIRRS